MIMLPPTWPKWLKIGISITVSLIGLVGSVAGGMWAIDAKYAPREIMTSKFELVAMTQKALLDKVTLGEIRSWLVFWQMQVEIFTGITAKNPNDTEARDQLNRALRERTKWQNKLNQHVEGD